MKKIKLTIQEIVKDFYCLGETEGFITGLAENDYINEKYLKEYHLIMKEMIDKYLPGWENKIDKEYWETNKIDEKGLILSTKLYKNFENIFYELI